MVGVGVVVQIGSRVEREVAKRDRAEMRVKCGKERENSSS